MKKFNVVASLSLALVLTVPTLVSAEQVKEGKSNIPIYFSNNVKDDLSPETKEKIVSQLSPTATSITIVESAPKLSVKTSNIGPSGNQCIEGGTFRNATQTGSYVFKLGTQGTRYINKSGEKIPFTSVITTSETIAGEVNGEGKFDWGPIEAKAGFKISGSYTWTTTESATLNIRPHYQGWYDFGTVNDYWSGYYAYVNSDCSEKNGAYINVNGPRQKASVANETWANF